MDKAQMINEIIGVAKNAALSAGKPADMADLFFSLAFKTERELTSLCKKLSITA